MLRFLLIAGLVVLAVAFAFPSSWNPQPGALCAATIILAGCVLGSHRYLVNGVAGRGAHLIILVSFLVTYPLSAIAHLIGSESEGVRGYFDLVRADAEDQVGLVAFSLVLVTLAFIALRLGLGKPTPEVKRAPLVRTPKLLLSLGACFIGLGVYGTVRLFGMGTSLVEEMTTVARDREFAGGLARYAFLARWLSWGITFLTAGLLQTRLVRSRVVVGAVFVGFLLAILANMYWGGGRGDALVAVMPGLFVIARLRPDVKGLFLIIAVPLLAGYAQTLTTLRTKHGPVDGVTAQVQSVVDWQAGRFSMVGLGVKMTDDLGLSWGSTLPSALLDTINAPSTLLKLPPIVPSARPVTSLVGEYLVGDPFLSYVVPGTILELYVNFGTIGVFIGYLLVGRFSAKAIRMLNVTQTVGGTSLAAYFVALIATSIIPGIATAWTYALATQGFPVLCLLLMERWLPWTRVADEDYPPQRNVCVTQVNSITSTSGSPEPASIV